MLRARAAAACAPQGFRLALAPPGAAARADACVFGATGFLVAAIDNVFLQLPCCSGTQRVHECQGQYESP